MRRAKGVRREQKRRFDLRTVQFETKCKMHTQKETRSRTEKFKSEFICAELKTLMALRWISGGRKLKEAQTFGEVSIAGPSLMGHF